MCGRFAVTLPSDAMAQLFAARPANDLPDVKVGHLWQVIGGASGK
ncbi:MAG: SOS response-associated peptidase, partial [Pseudomonadota bacterium]